jgi:hypothetical protein
MAADDKWIYPLCWCPTCQAGFSTVEHLIDHQLRKRHWGRKGAHGTSTAPPPPDPAGAALLREALEAAEARRQKEAHDDEPLSL